MHRLERAGRLPATGTAGSRALLFLWFCLVPSSSWAQVQDEIRFDTPSDFGGVGLLQTPTARVAPEGELSFASSRTYPFIRNAITLQPLPWLEGTLRYTTVLNRLYGPSDFSGDQRYKDKGFDAKFVLLQESGSNPQVAMGFRDFAGTGLFSSEYIVLNRRYYDLDLSLGIGWGNLGTRGQIRNPLAAISGGFRTRSNSTGQGGNFSVQYFHGDRASIFGGVSYRTLIPGLTLKLEFDGNNYQSEPQDNNQRVRSPFNFGFVYGYGDWLNVSLGVERGNMLMAQLAFRGDIAKSTGMPKFDPPPDKLKPRNLSDDSDTPLPRQKWQPEMNLVLQLSQALEAKNYKVDGISVRGKRATIKVSQSTFRAAPRAIGRAARIMANELPPEVEELTYVSMESGLEANRVTLIRKDLEKAELSEGSAEEIAANARIERPNPLNSDDVPDNPGRYPAFIWNWSPAMRHHIGGPDNPYFYQIFLRLDSELQLARGLSISGGIGFDIHNNFADLKLSSDSLLPHVRSDIKEYLKRGKNGITRLEADYLANLGSNWYGRISGGLLEEMFGGISTEVLYKPFEKRWAIGADVNRVQQRDYDERFAFRDFRTTTGHVDFYYQLPFYNLLGQLSVGRYLAGDRGVTVELSRRFENGSVLGVFATKTNVSAEQFGEGSFDKGFYVSVPVDLLSLYSTRSSIGMGWRPLTRDGGQRLNIGKRLYSVLRESGPESLMRDWSHLLD